MPMPVAHGLVGATLAAALLPRAGRRGYPRALLACALLANAADLDFVLVFAFHSRAWHRGFTHSLAFALALCLTFLFARAGRGARAAIAYGLAYASHALLDYATTREGGGLE